MDYFVFSDDKQHGPYSKDDLLAMYSNGSITDNTMIWCEGMADWTVFSQTEVFPKQTDGEKENSQNNNIIEKIKSKKYFWGRLYIKCSIAFAIFTVIIAILSIIYAIMIFKNKCEDIRNNNKFDDSTEILLAQEKVADLYQNSINILRPLQEKNIRSSAAVQVSATMKISARSFDSTQIKGFNIPSNILNNQITFNENLECVEDINDSIASANEMAENIALIKECFYKDMQKHMKFMLSRIAEMQGKSSWQRESSQRIKVGYDTDFMFYSKDINERLEDFKDLPDLYSIIPQKIKKDLNNDNQLKKDLYALSEYFEYIYNHLYARENKELGEIKGKKNNSYSDDESAQYTETINAVKRLNLLTYEVSNLEWNIEDDLAKLTVALKSYQITCAVKEKNVEIGIKKAKIELLKQCIIIFIITAISVICTLCFADILRAIFDTAENSFKKEDA